MCLHAVHVPPVGPRGRSWHLVTGESGGFGVCRTKECGVTAHRVLQLAATTDNAGGDWTDWKRAYCVC